MNLYIFKDGQNIGPLTPTQAQQGLQNGQFQLDDKAITKGMNDWTSLGEVLTFLQNQSAATAHFASLPAILPSPVAISASQTPAQGHTKSSDSTSSIGLSVLYYLVVICLCATIGKSLEAQYQRIPAIDFLHGLFNLLTFVSFFALLAGLVSPKIFESLATKIPPAFHHFFQRGVQRKHVGFVFGTAFILFVSIAGGTDAQNIEQQRQTAIAAQQQAVAVAKQKQDEDNQKKHEAGVKAENKRKLALAQLRTQKAEERAKEAETRRVEVQARLDEKVEEEKARDAQREAQEQAKAEEFYPVIRAGAFGVTITNNSASDWEDCRVLINAKFLGFGFRHKVSVIRAGQEIQIPMDEFTNKDDEFFTLTKYKINKIEIHADVKGKHKYFEGTRTP